jgi:hypothetical protein
MQNAMQGYGYSIWYIPEENIRSLLMSRFGMTHTPHITWTTRHNTLSDLRKLYQEAPDTLNVSADGECVVFDKMYSNDEPLYAAGFYIKVNNVKKIVKDDWRPHLSIAYSTQVLSNPSRGHELHIRDIGFSRRRLSQVRCRYTEC